MKKDMKRLVLCVAVILLLLLSFGLRKIGRKRMKAVRMIWLTRNRRMTATAK